MARILIDKTDDTLTLKLKNGKTARIRCRVRDGKVFDVRFSTGSGALPEVHNNFIIYPASHFFSFYPDHHIQPVRVIKRLIPFHLLKIEQGSHKCLKMNFHDFALSPPIPDGFPKPHLHQVQFCALDKTAPSDLG